MPIAGKIFWYRNPEVQQRLQVFSVQPHHQNGIGKIKRVHKDIRVDKNISASRVQNNKRTTNILYAFLHYLILQGLKSLHGSNR